MIAQVVDMEPYEFIWTTGDTHIYFDQLEKTREQVLLEPKPLCKLELNPEVKDLFAFTFDDIKIVDYQHHPKIKYNVSV